MATRVVGIDKSSFDYFGVGACVFFAPFTSFHDNAYSWGLASLLKVISIVDTFLFLLSPSLGGISSVPIVILLTFNSFINLCLTISAASTAVVIACPLAFKVTSPALDPVKLVITAKT